MTSPVASLTPFLAEPVLAHLASTGRSGAPHSVPVWVILRDDTLWFMSTEDSQMTVNLRRDPRFAISMTRLGHPEVMVTARCIVVNVQAGRDAAEVIDAIVAKYAPAPHPGTEGMVVFEARVEWSWGHDFSAGNPDA